MKLTKQGIEYVYHGDTLIYFWPWKASSGKFYSSEYNSYFNNFREYWRHVGLNTPTSIRTREKLQGFSYEEILAQWVKFKFPFEAVIILKDLNLYEKSLSFWTKIPKDRIEYMSKDVVILRCNDKQEITRIIESIDIEFAEAFGYYEGNLIDHNLT